MESAPIKDHQLIRRLRRIRVLVIHPDDEDRRMLLAHIKRIGCQVDSAWPAPSVLPAQTEVAMFLLNQTQSAEGVSWMAGSDTTTRVAIISYETPEILSELQRLHVHGVLSKPIRVFGVLAALTTSIGVASHEARLKQRIQSLDETLKARRKIEQAVAILSQQRGISKDEAYKRMRDKSMRSSSPIAVIADAIIGTSDL